MYKDYELTVAGGITPANPTEFIRTFPPRIIERVDIRFPPGPNREVYTRILHEAVFVFPLDPEQWINGEDETITITGPWAAWDDLFRLRIQLCSPGARLSHKVIYRFDLGELVGNPGWRGAFDRLASRGLPLPGRS